MPGQNRLLSANGLSINKLWQTCEMSVFVSTIQEQNLLFRLANEFHVNVNNIVYPSPLFVTLSIHFNVVQIIIMIIHYGSASQPLHRKSP